MDRRIEMALGILLGFAGLGVFAPVSLGQAAGTPTQMQVPEQSPLPVLREATLAGLFQNPLAYLGVPAHVTFQVEAVPADWNPYVTRFGPGDWAAVSAWGDEQLLWEKVAYDHPAGLLFARRGTPPAAQLARATRYERYSAEVVVRQVFLGRPWIEIRSMQRSPQQVTEGAVLHASRALNLMEGEHWSFAIEDFGRALTSDLPVHARAQLERLRTECQQRETARTAVRVIPAARSPKK